MAQRVKYCETCYDPATYVIVCYDADGFETTTYSCDECVDQYDEGWGDTIESLD